jgi:hypothetical protein
MTRLEIYKLSQNLYVYVICQNMHIYIKHNSMVGFVKFVFYMLSLAPDANGSYICKIWEKRIE